MYLKINSGGIMNKLKLLIFIFSIFYISVSAQVLTDITNFGGTPSTEFADSPSNESIEKLFDDLSETKFLSKHKSAWVEYKADEKYKVVSYKITSGNDAPMRDPVKWNLKASNDRLNWVILDRKENHKFDNRLATSEFSLMNDKEYQFFRFEFTQTGKTQYGDEYLQISEIEILGYTNKTIADFNSGTRKIKFGQKIKYNDISVNNPQKVKWYFEGGTPEVSCDSNPEVKYEKPGRYDVKLIVDNGINEDTIIRENYVIVSDPKNPWATFVYPDVEVFIKNDGEKGSKGVKIVQRLLPNIDSVAKSIALGVCKEIYDSADDIPEFSKLNYELEYREGLAYKGGNPPEITINFSTKYVETLAEQSDEAVKYELLGVFWHELTHAYQYYPKNAGGYKRGEDHFGFIEGMADYVRIHAGYHNTRKPSKGHWNDGYTTTGFFMNWIVETKDPDFMYKFNQTAKLFDDWSFDKVTKHILGRDVKTLWKEYESHLELKK